MRATCWPNSASRPRKVHFELFYVDEPPPPVPRADPSVEGDTSEVTIVLDGRATTSAMAERSTACWTAPPRSRNDLPFACKGGVCGTCRARVVSGEVDLRRNYALDDDELARGFVLTCQTYPVSDTIVIDFDA